MTEIASQHTLPVTSTFATQTTTTFMVDTVDTVDMVDTVLDTPELTLPQLMLPMP